MGFYLGARSLMFCIFVCFHNHDFINPSMKQWATRYFWTPCDFHVIHYYESSLMKLSVLQSFLFLLKDGSKRITILRATLEKTQWDEFCWYRQEGDIGSRDLQGACLDTADPWDASETRSTEQPCHIKYIESNPKANFFSDLFLYIWQVKYKPWVLLINWHWAWWGWMWVFRPQQPTEKEPNRNVTSFSYSH